MQYLFGWLFLFSRWLRLRKLKLSIKQIGEGVIIEKDFSYCSPDLLVIGDYAYINHNVDLSAKGAKIVLGEKVAIGPYTLITSFSHNYIDKNKLIRDQGDTCKEVNIGDGVWIGAHVTILAGVTVGEGAVVAAGAVVNKDVVPYSVVGGVPAKLIKMRK